MLFVYLIHLKVSNYYFVPLFYDCPEYLHLFHVKLYSIVNQLSSQDANPHLSYGKVKMHKKPQTVGLYVDNFYYFCESVL